MNEGPQPPWPAGAAWLDGRYRPIEDARISVLDLGVTRSDCTYDVVHVWQGRFYRLDAHLDRFAASMARLRLDPGQDRAAIEAILHGCVRRAGLRDAFVSMTCTRGRMPPGSRDLRTARSNLYCFAVPFVWISSPEQQQTGSRMWISDLTRIPPQSVDPTVKNYHWLDRRERDPRGSRGPRPPDPRPQGPLLGPPPGPPLLHPRPLRRALAGEPGTRWPPGYRLWYTGGHPPLGCQDCGSVHRRLPCQCPFRRIRATRGRHRPAWAPTTATPPPRPAHAAAIVRVRIAPLVLAGPASVCGGAVRAPVTPDSIRPMVRGAQVASHRQGVDRIGDQADVSVRAAARPASRR